VGDSPGERTAAWSAAGAAIMLLAGGAAGALWLLANHSDWELALAVLSTAVAGLGLYWMLAALIPAWWFPISDGTSTAERRGVIRFISRKEYQRYIRRNEDEA
jgi:hypothetical protein